MAANQFIFLERNIVVDSSRFSEAINYYSDMGRPYQVRHRVARRILLLQLLLFPEGTDKSPWTTAKSEEYARRNGLHPLRHVIYPRSTGFIHLLNKMRACWSPP
jgi:lysocardiolipin and lysophospholipid acyltransferase